MRISDWSSDVCSSDLSPSHFLRLFKVATGQTPHQFIVRRRVEKAQHLLRGTSQPIAQIAFACGFSHQQHFSNVFTKFNGMTPRSEEHTSELQSIMRKSYAVFCLQNKKNNIKY